MEYVGKLGSLFTSVQSFYNDINPATLSGAVDIVVVEQKDGDLACSPFHVRFGKLSLLMPQEKKIEIKVNGQVVPYLMKVGEAGESFFVFETEHEVPEEFQTSPIVGAVNESKVDEEPPFLDIGESKNQENAKQNISQDKDQFEDDDTNMKLPLPAELQSPKMIIEEQMDKVVTNMDPYSTHLHHHSQQKQQQQDVTSNLNKDIDNLTLDSQNNIKKPAPQNDVYPMDDGSSLLERVIPEAISTTTIAKETFIVRPANGDIYSKIMDVSHRSVQKRHDQSSSSSEQIEEDSLPLESTFSHQQSLKSQKQQKHQGQDDSEPQEAHGHNESIVLDIAGYKTDQNDWEEAHRQQVDNLILSTLEDEMKADLSKDGTDGIARAESPISMTKKDDLPQVTTITTTETTSESNNISTRLWGWGNSRRKGTNESQESLKNNNNSNNNNNNNNDEDDDMDDDDNDDDSTSIGTDTTKATDVSQTTTMDEQGNKLIYNNNNDSTPSKYQLVPGTIYRIEMSLCGLSAFGSDEKENSQVFEEHQITYDTFMHNPNLLNDKRLVFRYERRYYAAGHTGPLFTSLLLYKKPLQETSIGKNDHHPSTTGSGSSAGNVEDSRESYLFGKGWRQWLSRSSVAAPSTSTDSSTTDKSSSEINTVTANITETAKTATDDDKDGHDDVTTTFTTTTKTTTVGWNEVHNHDGKNGDDLTNSMNFAPRKNYAKTLRLTSEQLKQLGLNKGVNTISFSVTSAYQGTATCAAKIFYWDYDMPIVISDIDGTITKSDALGHVFTMIGKDWTHHGVAKLYTDICNNGYKILYLTSRAIGQADYTRDYLKKVEQGNYQLPDGPVIMSPDRLFTSFHREVIMRKPEVFKMACLKDIQRLFGGRDPFYAGFGNRMTDAISYRSVNVPASRIFTIDPYGDIKLELLKGFTSSYIHLNDLVDQIFPPVNTKTTTTDEEYNDWNFWKQPLPEIELPLAVTDTKKSPPTSPKPKPIKPDLSSLPTEAVLTSEKQQGSSRGSLLRSLTSMSSTSSSSLLSDTSLPPRRQSPSPPPSNITSYLPTTTTVSESSVDNNTIPTITTTTTAAASAATTAEIVPTTTTTVGNRNRVHSFTSTIRRSSLLLGTIPPSTSTPTSAETSVQDDDTMKQDDGDVIDKEKNQNELRPESPTSSGLMNHILSNGIGGVRNTLSRTFAYGQDGDGQQTEGDHSTTKAKDASAKIPTTGEKNQQEDEDDEEFDASLDDLEHDMDDIPFI